MTIKENIKSVREKMKSACIRSGRDIDEVKLVAVTKTIDAGRIMEVVECGAGILGENKVQEVLEKYDHVQGNVQWHMIGHLQTNKVKYIADKVSMIHSLDSIKLAEEIDRRLYDLGRSMDVLVEINIGGEESKHGIRPEDTKEFIESVCKYNNLKILGLMTVAPAFDDLEKVRPYFKEMKNIFKSIGMGNMKNVEMKYLSMGMTNDFEIALEEGSNIIRIGTGIFGPRKH